MATKEIKMFLHWDTSPLAENHPWKLFSCDMSEHGDVFVKEVVVTVEVPDNFDPTSKQVEMLQKKKQELETKFNAEVTRIETEISKLLSITYEPAEV
ncbi:MAG TPA: hypothetical protein VFM33_13980 [Aquabacterium sp.]|nr:hypothetical protein [Aquabacterium sp.]